MKVKQNDETITDFNIDRVYKSVCSETDLTPDESMNIAKNVYDYVCSSNFKMVESGFIRVLAYQEMIEQGFSGIKINLYAPIYTDISTLNSIDTLSLDDVNDNANTGRSPELIMKMKADLVSKQQNLRMFPRYVEIAHLDGDIHIHDLEYFRTRDFCADYDLRHTFYHGVSVDGTGDTASICYPAMNSTVAILHAVKVLGAGQVNSAGGQGFYNFLTFLSPYFKDLTYKEIEQGMQMFIFECTTTMVARGGQAVFSSVQLTPGVPKLWKDKPCVWKGKIDKDLTYGELDSTVRTMFEAFMKIMIKGDAVNRPFSFPKPEVNVKYEFLIDEETTPDHLTYKELYKLAVELSVKFGSTYYDNECTPKRKSQEGISCFQCCAYNFSVDPKKDPDFEKKMNFETEVGFSMGGSQCITINTPRLALKSKDLDDLKDKTEKLIRNVIIPIFHVKEKVRKQMYRPFFDYPDKERGIFNSNDLSYIIGYIGINEVVEIMTDGNITNNDLGLEYIIWLNDFVNTLSFEEQMEGRKKVALSRTPAETTCMRFAK